MIKDNINILRAFAILGVVAIHVTMNFTRFNELSWLPVALASADVYAHFAVPLFLLISGFVLSLKYVGEYNVALFYKKRISRLLAPYLIWSVIYLSLDYSAHEGISDIIFKLLTGGAYYHLWFFFLIFQLYLIFPFVRKFMKNKGFFIVIAALLIQASFRYFKVLEIENETLSVLLGISFLSNIVYFCLGIWLADNSEKAAKIVAKIEKRLNTLLFVTTMFLSILFGISWLGQHNNFFEVKNIYLFAEFLILPIVFTGIFINLNSLTVNITGERTLNVLNILSGYSFGIYLSHALFLRIVARLLKFVSITWENPVFYPASFAFAVILSVLFCYMIKKTKISSYVTGSQ
jgi:surface polysaccharide O-acyltransferase-like enzyme